MRAKSLILALFACFAFVQAGAQGPPSHSILGDPNKFADAHINGLDAQVHLSEQQKEKLRPLFVAEGRTLISILTDQSLHEDQRQQKIQQLHDQTRDTVLTMLTPSQLKQYSHPPSAQPAQHNGGQRI
jgi:hypothetical protein